jgi:choline/glycine/proline betaine transport protein
MAEWKENLGNFFEKSDTRRREQERGSPFARFIAEVAVPAFDELRSELEKHGREVTIRKADKSAAIVVHYHGTEEMTYRLQARTFPNRELPFAEIRVHERKGLKLIRVENMLRSGPPDYDTADISKDEIIRNFLDNYIRRVRPHDDEQ